MNICSVIVNYLTIVTFVSAVILNYDHHQCAIKSNETDSSVIAEVCECDKFQCYRKCCPNSDHVYKLVDSKAVLECNQRVGNESSFEERIHGLFDHNERNKTAFKVILGN